MQISSFHLIIQIIKYYLWTTPDEYISDAFEGLKFVSLKKFQRPLPLLVEDRWAWSAVATPKCSVSNL